MEWMELVVLTLIAMECSILLMRDMRNNARPRRWSATEDADGGLAEDEIDLEISHWSIGQLRAFCHLNRIECAGCETREDYMDAIERGKAVPEQALKDPEMPMATEYTDPDAYLMRECAQTIRPEG